jgi:hypothetical protein
MAAYKFTPVAMAMGLLALCSGCNVLDVDMTSTPGSVRRGDPVTFDIKLTNRSQCPLETSAAILIAFIPAEEFFEQIVGVEGEIPPDAPPEVLAFIEALRRFFDELCSGGEPALPEFPELATSCRRGEGEIICDLSGPLPAQQGSSGSMTFSGLGDRLQCEVDDGTMRCQLRIPLPNGTTTANATVATATQPLTCLIAAELGGLSEEGDAICFLGTFPNNIEGLGPSEMATGQVVLPARGAGAVRNLVFAISSGDDDLGVCKGGGNAGDACNPADAEEDCPNSTCGEGICLNGTNPGLGCDKATEAGDCGAGGTCQACDDFAEDSFLPLDCTTTIIAAEPVPVMSPWALVGMAAVLFMFGALWLQRRRGRKA